ncbi:MAG: hypothetical protein ACREVH_10750 [Gammaproteobacteria bacterium]
MIRSHRHVIHCIGLALVISLPCLAGAPIINDPSRPNASPHAAKPIVPRTLGRTPNDAPGVLAPEPLIPRYPAPEEAQPPPIPED